MTSPSSVPVHLLALERAARPAETSDAQLRSAIVNVAGYYLQLAQSRTPAQMEALIWGADSLDGADHGPSCAAFASLTLELAAQAVGEQSWVTGGSTYPWPLHEWADARVDENPASPGITSIVQDAQAHQRWHPLGDGYQPQPGDWVLFSGHVEVVTSYTSGVLDTIGADSLPNLTVNAHSFSGPLAQDGVEGFVDNGHLGGSPPAGGGGAQQTAQETARQTAPAPARTASAGADAERWSADIPGTVAPASGSPGAAMAATPAAPAAVGNGAGPATAPAAGSHSSAAPAAPAAASTADIPGDPAPAGVALATADSPARTTGTTGTTGTTDTSAPVGPGPLTAAPDAAVPGLPALPAATDGSGHGAIPGLTGVAETQAPYRKSTAVASATTPGTRAQQAFINEIAPGAIAAQQRFGVPASVTIAQAIDESGWGTSGLATQDHNLFGIKGTGPAGSVTLPSEEYENGQWVTADAQFRVYHNVSESISDHAELLATSGYYQRAMADRAVPDAFANDLTGVYATDPDYGATLIDLMRLYDLYRFDVPATPSAAPTASPAHSGPAAATRGPSADASIPGVVAALPVAAASPVSAARASAAAPAHPASASAAVASAPGTAAIPGSAQPPWTGAAETSPSPVSAPARPATAPSRSARATASAQARGAARVPGVVTSAAVEYQEVLPAVVATAFFAKAKAPLARAEQLHRDVADQAGLPWQLLAACDWMQCQADPRYSPVQGERLGTLNADGTAYRTKSAALAQCAGDLIELAFAIYGLDLTKPRPLSVRALADAFAAFRWGGLLKRHRVSAMEFPYAVAGLTAQHLKMHWPAIDDRDAPDRPGTRFRMPFGAVPAVLCLHYPATV